jgi:hypothetical protein
MLSVEYREEPAKREKLFSILPGYAPGNKF